MSEPSAADNVELFELEARRQIEHWTNSDLPKRTNVREIQLFDVLQKLMASVSTAMRERIGSDFVTVFPGAWMRPPALFGIVANARWPELPVNFWDVRDIKPIPTGPYLAVAPRIIPISVVTGSEIAKYIQVETATSGEIAAVIGPTTQGSIFGHRCSEDFDRLPWEVMTFEEAMAFMMHKGELFFTDQIGEIDIRLLGSMIGPDHIFGLNTQPSPIKVPKIKISVHRLVATVTPQTKLLICRQRL